MPMIYRVPLQQSSPDIISFVAADVRSPLRDTEAPTSLTKGLY